MNIKNILLISFLVWGFLLLFPVNASENLILGIEKHPETNILTIRLSKEVSGSTKAFTGRDSNISEQTPMVKELFTINGVKWVTLRQKQITIIKSDEGSWSDIIPQAEKIITKHLKKAPPSAPKGLGVKPRGEK